MICDSRFESQIAIAIKSRDLWGQKGVPNGPFPATRSLVYNFSLPLVDFPGGFFWALFPAEMRRKYSGTKSLKKSCGSRIKICKKSVLPKTDPRERENVFALLTPRKPQLEMAKMLHKQRKKTSVHAPGLSAD